MKLLPFTLILVAALATAGSAQAAAPQPKVLDTSCEETEYNAHAGSIVQQCEVLGAHVTIMLGDGGEATCDTSNGNIIIQVGDSHNFRCQTADCGGNGNIIVQLGDHNDVDICGAQFEFFQQSDSGLVRCRPDVQVAGEAEGCIAVAIVGEANGDTAIVGAGEANGETAIAGAGYASGGRVAVAGYGQSTARDLSITVVGNSTGMMAISVLGCGHAPEMGFAFGICEDPTPFQIDSTRFHFVDAIYLP